MIIAPRTVALPRFHVALPSRRKSAWTRRKTLVILKTRTVTKEPGTRHVPVLARSEKSFQPHSTAQSGKTAHNQPVFEKQQPAFRVHACLPGFPREVPQPRKPCFQPRPARNAQNSPNQPINQIRKKDTITRVMRRKTARLPSTGPRQQRLSVHMNNLPAVIGISPV